MKRKEGRDCEEARRRVWVCGGSRLTGRDWTGPVDSMRRIRQRRSGCARRARRRAHLQGLQTRPFGQVRGPALLACLARMVARLRVWCLSGELHPAEVHWASLIIQRSALPQKDEGQTVIQCSLS